MPHNKPYTEAELLDILLNSDDDELFLVQVKEDNGWDILPDDSDPEISEGEIFENVSDHESIFEDPDDNDQHDQHSNNDDVGYPPQKEARVDDDIFKWTKADFHPTIHDFKNEDSGCKIDSLGDSPSPLEIFEHFLPTDFVEEIVNQTINYYQYVINKNPASALKNYRPTDVNEMYTFFGVCLLMPLTKKYRLQVCWTKEFIIETPIFGQVMSRGRYFQILRFLHFCDNDNIDKNDRLYKIRCVVDHYKNSFKNSLYSFQKPCHR